MSPVIEPKVDFYLAGDWLEKTSDVYQSPAIRIQGGTRDEGSDLSPGRCQFTVGNTSGDYNPRDPNGQYFGDIGKNTPVRVRVPLVEDDVSETDTDGWGAKWDNGPSAGGTVANTNWTRSGTTNSHSVPASNAYRRSLLKSSNQFWDSCTNCRVTLPTSNITGDTVLTRLEFRYQDSSNFVYVEYYFKTDETIQIQVLDVIAGSVRTLLSPTTISGLSVATDQSFELSALVEGPVVRAKVWATGDPEPADWQVEAGRASVRYGQSGITSYIFSSNSNTKPFVFQYTNVVVDGRPFVGECSSFTPRVADEDHNAPSVEITASGITQRTKQGQAPFKSATRRWWTAPPGRRWIREAGAFASAVGTANTFKCLDASATGIEVGQFFRLMKNVMAIPSTTPTSAASRVTKEDQLFTITNISSSAGTTTITFTPDALVATAADDEIMTFSFADDSDVPIVYWPLEDERAATVPLSGLIGGSPLSVQSDDSPTFGEDTSFDGFGSQPILQLDDADLFGVVPDYTNTNQALTLHFVVNFPAVDEASTGTDFIQFFTNGTAERYELVYASGGNGSLRIIGTDQPSGSVLFDNTHDLGLRGTPRIVIFAIYHTGASTVEYTVTAMHLFPYGGGGYSTATATATSVTDLGKITNIRVNPNGGYDDVGLGHLGVIPNQYGILTFMNPVSGWRGENVARRMIRIAFEEDVDFTYVQGTEPGIDRLGSQQYESALAGLQAAADADAGRLYEARGAYRFEYRQRSSLYGQDYFLDVDYANGGVLPELVPEDDDKDTRNDITVKRVDGGSYRVEQTTGRLSTSPPSEGGVGRYVDQPELLLGMDEYLSDAANWRLHLGTVDEERYPTIRFTLAGDVTLAKMMSAGVGNRLRLTGLEARSVFEPIDQLVIGYTLTLDPWVPVLEINGEPARPYQTGLLDDTDLRLDSDTSTLSEDLDTTETGVDVATTGGTLWVTTASNPSEFPFDVTIGGERMTVTAITGSSSPQTFTVTRSVNGVVKTHATGASVSLADPMYIAL